MSEPEFMWECICGHVEYSKKFPKKCIKCGKSDEFMQVSEGNEETAIINFRDDLIDEALGDEE